MKPATVKRAATLPLASDYTKQFQKDWERYGQAGRHDMGRLKEVMLLIVANEGPLPPEWKDHALSGEWKGHRELHVGGDFLLVYKQTKTDVVFTRIGTHAELFR